MIKKITIVYRAVFSAALLFLTLASSETLAQCPGCVVDPTCATLLPDGGLCPDIIPAATVGQAYDTDVTFYIPQHVSDPATGLDVDVNQVTITQVNGLPLGLDWECNNASSGCFYTPPSNPPDSELGCVKICGTPFGAPGTYSITVDVIAEVYVPALGITLTEPSVYDVTFDLMASAGGATDFTYTGEPDCSLNYLVEFHAQIDGSPQPTSYSWDFGNGNTSTLKDPPVQAYAAPGSYTATLQTQILEYKVTTVNLNSMDDNWCGDVEEPNWPFLGCTASPDPFFEIRDAGGNTLYTSSTIDDVLSASWTGLNIVLSNPPYSIEFTDEDVISTSDALGTFTFDPTADGVISFASSAGTSGTLTIGSQVQSTFDDSAVINAFSNPYVGPFFSITDATQIGGSDGAVDMTIDGGVPPYSYLWSNGATTEDLSGVGAGTYAVAITDMNGCTITDTAVVNEPADVPCGPPPANLFVVIVDSKSVVMSWDALAQPVLGYRVSGRPVGLPGWLRVTTLPTSLYVGHLTPGETYQWKVEAKCYATGNISDESTVETFTMPLLRDGAQIEENVYLDLYPNPSSGEVSLTYSVPAGQQVRIEVTDGLGRVMKLMEFSSEQGMFTEQLHLSGLASGIYFVSLQSEHDKQVKRLIIE